jgi:hypothetical protein
MRLILAIVAIVLVLFAVGWITVSKSPTGESTTITIETGKMKAGAQETMDKGEKAINDARAKIKKDL